MKVLFITASLVALFNCACNADESNYCHDPESNLQWEILIMKYPDDKELAALHALRLGLCYKIDRGDIGKKLATEIFENVRRQLIDKKIKENLTAQKNGNLEM